jgi:hypothetical protein
MKSMVPRTAHKSSVYQTQIFHTAWPSSVFICVSYFTVRNASASYPAQTSCGLFSISDPNRRPDSPSNRRLTPTGNPRTLRKAWKTTVVHIWDCSWTRPPCTTALCWGASCQAGYGTPCPTFFRRGCATTLAGP